MQGIEITGHEEVSDRLSAFLRGSLSIIESEAIRGIRESTAEGKQPDGAEFAPLLKAQFKRRQRLGLRTSPTNLRVKTEDSLLDTLAARKIEDNETEIYTTKEGQGEGVSKKRPFLGINAATEARIVEHLDREFERMLA